MRVLLATAELSPLARVGGLAEACAGLVAALRADGVDVEVVLPDYEHRPLHDESVEELDAPWWVGPARARRGVDASGVEVTLVDAPSIARPHPYLDPATGEGWTDNDHRFFAFSACIASLVRRRWPDVVHLNDWHTAAVPSFLEHRPPTVLTIHTIGYQGWAGAHWLDRMPHHREAFAWFDGVNPLAGGIALADRVIAVSPNYAREILTPAFGVGLHERLAALGDRLVGIRNGIDHGAWDPATDGELIRTYDASTMDGKAECRAALHAELGWHDDGAVVVGMVTRLADQKGVDLALDAMRFLAELPGRFVLLGAGDRALAAGAHALAAQHPDRVAFHEGYDHGLGHRIFGGADLFVMPSRFEPCGLAQMQAMAYGTIPVVTDVGGLRDTVVDDDRHRGEGNGFVSLTVDAAGTVDALHRAARAWRQPARRKALQRRGMTVDWSWTNPARRHVEVYESVMP